MKKTTYFGNRFKTALRGFRKRASRRLAVTAAPTSEFELLESRLLLSGLTGGTKIFKSLNFVDVDGDKVSIKITGKLAKDAGFQLDSGFLGGQFGGGNVANTDIGQLNLVGLTSANALNITVKPVKLQASDKITSNVLWSPGYTNIGSITSEASTNASGTAVTASSAVRNITLNAAVVGDIDLANTDVTGNLQLTTGRTAFTDRSNIAAVFGDTASYNPVAGLIDFYDISAKSIGQITISGVIAAPANNPYAPASDITNDFLGNITTSGNLGGITGVRSSLNGLLNVGGDLGEIHVGQLNGNITVGGDAVFDAPANFAGSFVAGGHLHLGLDSGQPGNGNFFAGAGISGLNPSSEIDAIIAPAGFLGTLNNSSTSAAVGTGIADITVVGGNTAAAFGVFSGNSVGNITGAALGAMTVNAGTSIGNLTTTAGSLDGTYAAGTSIGNITATNANGDGILGDFIAGTSIGNILAKVTGPGDGISGANFTAGTTIGTVTSLISGPTGGDGIEYSNFNANSGIGAISVTVNGVGEGINYGSFNADADGDLVGSLATITVVHNSTSGDAIDNSDFSGASIGNISVTLNKVTADDGIDDSNFNATAGDIGTVTVSSKGNQAINNSTFNATGNIGVIIATALTGDGIDNGDFTADSDGDLSGALSTITASTATGSGIANGSAFSGASIGAISAKVSGNGDNAISDSYFAATAGNIGTISAITAGTSASSTDAAIAGSAFVATGNIGNIAAAANAGDGIRGSYFTADTDTDSVGDLGTITVSSVTGSGIYSSNFNAVNIGDASAQVTGDGNDGIANSTFTAKANIGNLSASTLGTGTGDAAFVDASFFAGGNIGNITATALAGSAIDVRASGIFSATGNIGNITAKTTDTLTTSSVVVGDGIADVAVFAGGNVGTITITNSSNDVAADGMEDVKFDVTGTMDAVSITTAGGVGMLNASIDPSSIASVTIVSPDVAMNNADIISSGTIGTINITGDVTKSSLIEAETDFTGPLTITGELKYSTVRSNTGDITGPIVVTEGISLSNITATEGNIGTITTTAMAYSNITIGAEGTLGDLTVNATEGAAIQAVNIGFTAPLPGVEASASFGDITVTNTGTNLTDTGITNSTFQAGGYGTGIGDITVTVAGGVAVENVDFLAPYIAANPTATDEGLFVTPISAYSVNSDTAVTSTSAPLPIGLTGNIEFSTALNHTRVDGNGGFPAWNSGGVWGDTSKGNIYDGDVYATTGNNVIVDLIPGIGESSVGKLVFYVLGTDPSNNDFRITLPGGDQLILEDVSFATAVEVTATDVTATALTTITVESGNYNSAVPSFTPGGTFGIGEFSATAAATPVLPAGTASIGNITVVNTGGFASSSGLVDVNATAAIDIGNIDVTVGTTVAFPFTTSGGDGIAASNFTAQSGKIGTVDVVNTSADVISDGIFNSNFTAAGDIGNIDVSAVGGNGMYDADFTADSDAKNGGSIGTVTSQTVTGDYGIVYSDLIAAAIGNISAKVTGEGLDAIYSSNFTATAGDIGTVTASSAGTATVDGAIDNTAFTATGSIGNITATAVGGDAIYNSNFTADSDADNAGDIGTITAETSTGSAIYNSTFKGANVASLGDISAKVTGDGNTAIDSSTFTATNGNIGNIIASTLGTALADSGIANSAFTASSNIGNVQVTSAAGSGILFTNAGNGIFATGNLGNIEVDVNATSGAVDGIAGQGLVTAVIKAGGNAGNIDISNLSVDAAADGLDNVKIDVTGTLGTVTITAAGGAAMNASSIDPTSIGAIALNGKSAAMSNSSEILTSGAIDSLAVTGDIGTGSSIKAGSFTTPDITITGQLAGAIAATAGSIGKVSVTTANGGTISASGTVGDITITGDIGAGVGLSNQKLSVDGTSVGNITATGITTNDAEVTIIAGGSVTSVGNINVGNNTGDAGLAFAIGAIQSKTGSISADGDAFLANGGALTTIGAVSIGGDLTLNSAFTNVTTASTFGANKVLGGRTFGAGAGATVGLITIGDGGAAANSVTFNFATINGKTNATADAVTLAVDFLTGAGPDITTLQAAAAGGQTTAGVTAILI